MKLRRFQSEAARLFDSKILCEPLHAKNVVEASVLCSSGCTGTICGGSRRLGNWVRSQYQGRRKSESASSTLAFEYIAQGLFFVPAHPNRPPAARREAWFLVLSTKAPFLIIE